MQESPPARARRCRMPILAPVHDDRYGSGKLIFALASYFPRHAGRRRSSDWRVLSGAAASIGMKRLVRANVRTAQGGDDFAGGRLELAFKGAIIRHAWSRSLAARLFTPISAYRTHFLCLPPTAAPWRGRWRALLFGASLTRSPGASLAAASSPRCADVGGDLVAQCRCRHSRHPEPAHHRETSATMSRCRRHGGRPPLF